MDKAHHQHLETAFLQLSFSIKLWHFLDEHPIDKDKFDVPLTLTEPGSIICLAGGEFHEYQDLQLAAGNNISIVFGAVGITLWEAIREYSGLRPDQLDPKACYRENLAALSYMIRCCYAHGTAAPVWSIRNAKYRVTYRVGNKSIDLSTVQNGQVFDYKSIGGAETLRLLKVEAERIGLV